MPRADTPHDITMSGTILNITIGSPVAGLDYTCIAHLELVALDQVGVLTTQAPEVRVAGLYVEALMSASVFMANQFPIVFVAT